MQQFYTARSQPQNLHYAIVNYQQGFIPGNNYSIKPLLY